jgi:hypothetical protein
MLCPTPESALLRAAGDDGVKCSPPTHIERPNPFGAMNLVAREREEIDTEVVDAGRNLAHALYCIGMYQDTPAMRQRRTCLN